MDEMNQQPDDRQTSEKPPETTAEPARSDESEAPPEPADTSVTTRASADLRGGKQPNPPLVVGIGASAGGLESLQKLFSNVPDNPGIAFVVIVHLLPNRDSLMPELLQRHSRIPVVQIADGMPLEKNRVHIIPPNFQVKLLDGVFRLTKAEREIPLAQIDLFLRSLAEVHGESAVAVILSGAGSDGAMGVRVIKERLGIAIAENPETARYRSMPDAAINTGLVDRVLSADEIPAFLVELASSERTATPVTPADDQSIEWTLRRIFFTLRSRTGHDFSGYKRNTILRRLDRRMFVHHIDSLSHYAEFLQETPNEVAVLFKDLLIGVTRFFREPESFAILQSDVFPAILQYKPEGGTVRVWTPGVATGEEAYSIAILLQEIREKHNKDFKIQIFSTDIDSDAIGFARAGLYPPSIAADVNQDRLQRFFEKEGDQYRIRRSVRENVIFAEQNVIKDPPFTRLDLISCRNLLIYLNSDLQHRLLPLFHYSLCPRGFLMLGTSESVGEFSNLFSTVDAKWRVFRVREGTQQGGTAFDLPMPSTPLHRLPSATSTPRDESSLHRLTSHVLLDKYAPPAVVINVKGDVLFVHGRTGRFLEPAPGRENRNIVDMARPGLNMYLPSMIREATVKGIELTRENIKVKVNGGEAAVNVSIRPLKAHDQTEPVYMITFESVSADASVNRERAVDTARNTDIHALEDELRNTRENLQTVVEELEASNEELRSTNEEHQSANEELKSTNEELETSREELQSLNEELATINREMEEKMDVLKRASEEVTSLLNSLGVPTVFLDNDLRIRRFTVQARELIHLIDTDIGRPFADITYDVEDSELLADAGRVLSSMVYHQKEVQTTGGHWYLRRIIPYRSSEDKVSGVVINFVDIHELKLQTDSLRETRRLLGHAKLTNLPLVLLDENLLVEAANQPFYLLIRAKKDEVEAQSIFDIGRGQFDTPDFRRLIEQLQRPSEGAELIETEMEIPGLGRKRVIVYARRLFVGEMNQARFLLEIDTTEK